MKQLRIIALLLILFITASTSVYAAGPNLLPNSGMEVDTLLLNGSFETGNPPTYWNVMKYGSLAQSGTYSKVGDYSIAVNHSDGDVYASQSVTGLTSDTAYTLGAWVYAGTQNMARIAIDDGTRINFSNYHGGTPSWEWLTVTETIDSGTTSARVYLVVENVDNGQQAYFDGALFAEDEYHNESAGYQSIITDLDLYQDFHNHPTAFTDSLGNNNTYFGVEWWPNGLYFDGSNDYVKMATTYDIPLTAKTIDFWMFLYGWGEDVGQGRIIVDGKFRLRLSKNQQAIVVTSDGGSTKAYSATGSISLYTWDHVKATIAADGTCNIYINGALSGTADQASGTPAAGTTDPYIGNGSATANTFHGVIDDLKIYNGIVSGNQNYYAGLASGRYVDPINLLTNAGFETGDPPTGWTLGGAGATFAADAITYYEGAKSGKLTRNGTNCYVLKLISATALRGKYIYGQVWANASVANRCRWYWYDGTNTQIAPYHSGGSSFECLKNTSAIVSPNAINISVYLQVLTGDTTAYFDSAILVEGTKLHRIWQSHATEETPKDLPIAWVSSGTQQYPNQLNEITENILTGTYSLTLSYHGINIYSSGTVPFSADYRYQPYIASAYVYPDTIGSCRIYIYDGIDSYYSNYNTGTGSWEYLTVSHYSDIASTELGLHLLMESGSISYWDETELYDDTAECPSSLVADNNSNTIDLSWEPGAETTYIWANADTYPTEPGDGDLVYSGTGTTTIHEDLSLINDFYYRAWGHNWAGYSDCYDDIQAGGVVPLWYSDETPTWWEENIMIIALAIMLVGFTVAGYALWKGELAIIGGLCMVIFGGYAYLQSDNGVSPLGTASILIGIVIMLAGAMMWRHKNEEQEDDEIDLDGENEDTPNRKRSKQRRESMRMQSIERRRFQRDLDETD